MVSPAGSWTTEVLTLVLSISGEKIDGGLAVGVGDIQNWVMFERRDRSV